MANSPTLFNADEKPGIASSTSRTTKREQLCP
ncbi:predicted protein [Sclerotinia sclerotiorum 1980 UF-70]|uniref:Uncharacterized protein n=1 Tax=Sclerotinia sclerotiorum (strain ATCC 18683 / 1980 / Ss-1) TaxID=665079 RepID=A7F3F0_SCLS1|nr:predicted protein [Sclerotinia sclerotiorum 1980 UF-70]EDN97271.1 predicted protein [Sclerotinia sclerotiorum 1980 UF-70]